MFPPANPVKPTDETGAFLVELAGALSTYGTPAHRLEDAMAACAERLGVAAQFFAMPTAVLASIGAGQYTHLIRVEPGEVHLERLARLDAVLSEVTAGRLAPGDGLARVRAIVTAPPRYASALAVACYGVVSAATARFFGGGAREVVASGAIGLVVGLLAVLAYRYKRSARVAEFAAGLVATALALAAARYAGPLSARTVLLGGVIGLMPGLAITMAVTELATRNLVAGTARLMGAFTVLASIGFGVAIGYRLGIPPALAPPTSLASALAAPSPWTEVAALVAVPPALTVLFSARPKDLAPIAAASVVAFYGARAGAALFGSELGVCVGAFLLGLGSNAWARAVNGPAATPMLPGLVLLVPGGIGFRSFAAFLDRDALAGVATAFSMVLVAVGLVTGLLLANVALPARKAL